MAGMTSYQVYLVTGGGTLTFIQAAGAPASNTTVTGLGPATLYAYRVRATNASAVTDTNTVDRSFTTSSLGTFTTVNPFSINEGASTTTALLCSDASSNTSVFSLVSQSDAASNCSVTGTNLICAPSYKTGHSNWNSTATIRCAINASNLDQAVVITASDINRTPLLTTIAAQSVTSGSAITQINATDTNSGGDTDIPSSAR